MRKDKMVWGALLHLGSNMWDDFLDDPDGWAKSPEEERQRPNPMGPSDKKKRSRYRSYLRCNDAIWKGNVDHCAAEGRSLVARPQLHRRAGDEARGAPNHVQ